MFTPDKNRVYSWSLVMLLFCLFVWQDQKRLYLPRLLYCWHKANDIIQNVHASFNQTIPQVSVSWTVCATSFIPFLKSEPKPPPKTHSELPIFPCTVLRSQMWLCNEMLFDMRATFAQAIWHTEKKSRRKKRREKGRLSCELCLKPSPSLPCLK